MSRQSIASLLIIIFLVGYAVNVRAGKLYTDAELWSVGNHWKQTRAQWHAEVARHNATVAKIDKSTLSPTKKDFLLQKEARYHRAVSKQLAHERAKVQNVLIDESNARVSYGDGTNSEKIHATLGTDIDDPAYRDMRGDLDGQGSPRTLRKVEDTLKDMGLEDLLPPPDQRRPGTLELGDDFEMVLHKSGVKPTVGDEFHYIKNNIDARNPESFVSAQMNKDPIAGTKQAGSDYVETQDHLKKASKGHKSTGEKLIKNPDDLQAMAKSTNKTLDMGHISDDELGAILQNNKIPDSPAEFRYKLTQLKQERLSLDNADEAEKLRKASQDIFESAQEKTARQAEGEIKAKRASAKKLQENIEKTKRIVDNPDADADTKKRASKLLEQQKQRLKRTQDEIFDSVTKIKAVETANLETGARNANSPKVDTVDKPHKVAQPDTTTPRGMPDPKPSDYDRLMGGKKGVEIFGILTDIADVGHAAKVVQEYREGKASSGEVVRKLADATPGVGTMVGLSEKAGTSAFDAYKASSRIQEANETEMQAYLQAWEKQFRLAGMTGEDARKYIGNAVLAGNLDVLEAKADQLRVQGKTIETPQLVVHEMDGPDNGALYMLYNTKDTIVGGLTEVGTGLYFLVGAPAHAFVAYTAEQELIETTLETDVAIENADMEKRLFRALLNAGIDQEQALTAVQQGGMKLRAARIEATKNITEIKKQQEAEDAARLERLKRIISIHRSIDKLRFMNASVSTDPGSPIDIPRDTSADSLIEFTAEVDSDLAHVIDIVQMQLTQINETAPTIDIEYAINLKGAEPIEPGVWNVKLPAVPNQYPVTIEIIMSISGFTGDLAPLPRIIRRSIEGTVLLRYADESIQLDQQEFKFKDCDYEPITATVSGQTEDRKYIYLWNIDGREELTEEPQLWFSAELQDPQKEQIASVTVQMYDAYRGIPLDHSSASLTITPHGGVVLLRGMFYKNGRRVSEEEGGEWITSEMFTCSDVIESRTFSEPGLHYEVVDRYRDREQPSDPKTVIWGLPHGRYIAYDLSGKIVVRTGTYKHGAKHGKWITGVDYEDQAEFKSYGQGGISVTEDSEADWKVLLTKEIIHYVNGKKHGTCSQWRPNGKLRYTGSYQHDKKHGEWKLWRRDGSVEYIHNFHEGKLHGLQQTYRDNGTLFIERHFKNGVQHGLERSCRADGTLDSEYTYKDGKLNGPYRSYYPDGTLWVTGHKAGGAQKNAGVKTWYREDGSIESTLDFGTNKKTRYREDGSIERVD